MNTEQLKELVALDKQKDELSVRLSEITDRMEALKEMILTQFLTAGVQNLRVDGRLISLRHELYAGALKDDRPLVVQALREADMAIFIEENFNAGDLKNRIREIADEIKEQCLREGRLYDEAALREGLPEPLRKCLALRLGYKHSLQIRKG